MKDIMVNKYAAYFLSGFLMLISLSAPCYAANELTPIISDIITECQTIKPGLTRADLYRVFGTEGGMYSARDRSFVYHACNLLMSHVAPSTLVGGWVRRGISADRPFLRSDLLRLLYDSKKPNKALLGTRHKVSGPQNANVQRPGKYEFLR